MGGKKGGNGGEKRGKWGQKGGKGVKKGGKGGKRGGGGGGRGGGCWGSPGWHDRHPSPSGIPSWLPPSSFCTPEDKTTPNRAEFTPKR